MKLHPHISIRLARNKGELEKAFKIREIVFINEQHVSRRLERDWLDGTSKHVLLFLGGKAVGAARVRFEGKTARLQRMAILKQFRGRGLGKALVRHLLSYGRRHGAKNAVIHAQYYLKEFYSGLGFVGKGKPFQEACIQHIQMVRAL